MNWVSSSSSSSFSSIFLFFFSIFQSLHELLVKHSFLYVFWNVGYIFGYLIEIMISTPLSFVFCSGQKSWLIEKKKRQNKNEWVQFRIKWFISFEMIIRILVKHQFSLIISMKSYTFHRYSFMMLMMFIYKESIYLIVTFWFIKSQYIYLSNDKITD